MYNNKELSKFPYPKIRRNFIKKIINIIQFFNRFTFSLLLYCLIYLCNLSASEVRVAIVGEPEELRSKVEASLISIPYCKVIDIHNRKTLLNEIKMGQTGLFEESKVATAGKMVGAEKIIFILKKSDTNIIRMVDIETGVVEGSWVNFSHNEKNVNETIEYSTLIRKMLEGLAMNRALSELKEKDSGKINIKISFPKNHYKGGEELSFQVESDTSGYLTLIDIQPDGSIIQLLPNKTGMTNEIIAGKIFDFPGKFPLTLLISPPYGKDTLRAIVSKKPLNLFKKNELEEGEISCVKSGQSMFNTKGITMKIRTVPEGDWGMSEFTLTTSE